MFMGRAAQILGRRCGGIERVLQSYLIASVVSTSGVDVLLMLTVLLLLLVSVRQVLAFFGNCAALPRAVIAPE